MELTDKEMERLAEALFELWQDVCYRLINHDYNPDEELCEKILGSGITHVPRIINGTLQWKMKEDWKGGWDCQRDEPYEEYDCYDPPEFSKELFRKLSKELVNFINSPDTPAHIGFNSYLIYEECDWRREPSKEN